MELWTVELWKIEMLKSWNLGFLKSCNLEASKIWNFELLKCWKLNKSLTNRWLLVNGSWLANVCLPARMDLYHRKLLWFTMQGSKLITIRPTNPWADVVAPIFASGDPGSTSTQNLVVVGIRSSGFLLETYPCTCTSSDAQHILGTLSRFVQDVVHYLTGALRTCCSLRTLFDSWIIYATPLVDQAYTYQLIETFFWSPLKQVSGRCACLLWDLRHS